MSLRNLSLLHHAVRQCNRQLPLTVLTTHVRHIKAWVRPMIHSFNRRKEMVEFFKAVYPIKPDRRSRYSDWNYNSELYAFGKRLGENFEDSLLRVAFTDKSFLLSEIKRQQELGIVHQEDMADNEQLSHDGLHFIKKTITQVLAVEFPQLPKEMIPKLCDVLTSPPNLASISFFIGTKDLILSDDYPPSEEVYCRALQAIVAALEKSSGTERSRSFVMDIIMTQLVGKDVFELLGISRPWSLLLDILRGQGQPDPEPRIIAQAGKNTILAAFTVGIYNADKKLLGKGFGETLDIAHEMAANDVLRDIYGLRRPKNGFNFLLKAPTENNTKMLEQSKQKSLN